MKTTLKYFIKAVLSLALLSIGLMVIVTSHYALKPVDADEITVMEDATDPHTVCFNASEFIQHKCLATKNQHLKLNIMSLTEVDFNPRYTITWSDQAPLLSNPYDRDNRIASFTKHIEDTLRKIRQTLREQQESHLYEVIVKELNRLTATGTRCTLIVFSDLREHSPLFDIYNPDQKRGLINSKATVVDKLRKATHLRPTLAVVYFICSPKTLIENEDFRLMSDLFRSVFEEAGAKVIIAANLNADV